MNTLFLAQAAVPLALILWMARISPRSASGFCIQLAASTACLWASSLLCVWLSSVGKSGNSGEPHLHVYAQRPVPVSTP